MRKKRTLQVQLSRLLQMTIFSLIFMGSMIYCIASLIYIKDNNLSQLEHVLNDFYNEVVSDSKSQALRQAQELAEVINLQIKNSDESILSNTEVEKAADGFDFWIFDENKQIIKSKDSISINLSSNQIEKMLHKTEVVWIGGNTETGIYAYSIQPISGNDAISYVLVAVEIANDKYVKKIKEDYGIDASIFYQNTRIVTSVQEKNHYAINTKISDDIYSKLLAGKVIVKGYIKVVGTPYLAAYRSFGNSDEALSGIVGVGKPLNDYLNIIRNIFLSALLVGLFLMGLSVFISRKWLDKHIVEPIKLTTEALIYIGEGHKNYQDNIATTNQFEEFNQLNLVIYNLINEIDDSKKVIEKIAYYNELTQLPNRYHLFNKWAKVGAEDANRGFLMCLDMNNLKMVNDLLGHKMGDRIIIAIADRLTNHLSISSKCELYHFGGGEFIISSVMIDDHETVEQLTIEILESLNIPFQLDSNVINTTITIGIALFDEQMVTIEQVVQNAGVAVDQAKKAKSSYLFYTDKMVEQLMDQNEFEEDLKHALVNNELFLVYQPKLDLQTGQCHSFEALIRWRCPKRGIVSPIHFIQVAEEKGLIIEIGQWVLEEACKFAKRLQLKYFRDIKVAVNISTLQVIKEDFVRCVLTTLLRYEVNPQCIELEITESVLIEYLTTAVEKLRQLSVLGVDISIDDFGKGYSSLAYLRRLPITTLKIDKLFIDDIIETQDSLVDHIIEIGHHMGLKVIAEGVEVAAQLNYLKLVGCDYIQGYYYSRPLTEENAYIFMDSENVVEE